MHRILVTMAMLAAAAVTASAQPLSLQAPPTQARPPSVEARYDNYSWDSQRGPESRSVQPVASAQQRWAATAAGSRQAAAAPPAPSYTGSTTSYRPAPTHYAIAERSRLGGGFIEFLANQLSSGESARDEAPAVPAPVPDPGAFQQAYAVPPAMSARTGLRQMNPKFLPRTVAYIGPEKPGTIIVDTEKRYLYLVEDGGKAKRYGIGVGRPGFTWAGIYKVTAKKKWPAWRPPADMLKRRPDLPRFMPGGPDNPLGARALYLGSTLYRIHGSNAPWTIGHAVSSGCIRMRNVDVIDLYNRVNVGTKVVVI